MRQSINVPGGTSQQEEYGQGWTQMTEHGKIYLSKKEKNVFILEGTKAAGFSAAVFNGGPEQRSLIEQGAFTLTCELKCAPGDQCPDQQIFVMIDSVAMSDLSSGCDFCGVRLGFDSREVRVESHRRNSPKKTLFAQPGCALLRPQAFVTLAVTVCDDSLSITLSGVSLISNLPIGRPAAPDRLPQIGVAVYGKTRCYLRRFRMGAATPEPGAVSRPVQAMPPQSPARVGVPPQSPAKVGVGGGGEAFTVLSGQAPSSSSRGVPRASHSDQPVRRTAVSNQAMSNVMAHPQANMAFGGGSAGEEMELAVMIERDIVVADLNVRFDDIGGLDSAKKAMNEAVVLPLILPEFFTGIRKPWKGVLLFGPPGTGKTMLAKAAASSTENLTFFNCSSATLTSKWRGESEKLLRALFTTARARVPSILFFDEIDAMLSQRGGSAEHEASRRFKSEFLIHLDGLMSDAPTADGSLPIGHLLVLATSNTPWDLDEALRRRLEKRIYIPLPDEQARLRMFTTHLKDITVSGNVDLVGLAARTANYSGADIQLICRDASMNPMRRAVEGFSPMELVQLRDEGKLTPGGMPVEMADFEAALSSISPSVCLADCQRYVDWAKEFGSK